MCFLSVDHPSLLQFLDVLEVTISDLVLFVKINVLSCEFLGILAYFAFTNLIACTSVGNAMTAYFLGVDSLVKTDCDIC